LLLKASLRLLLELDPASAGLRNKIWTQELICSRKLELFQL
jgi:hypothetical protein